MAKARIKITFKKAILLFQVTFLLQFAQTGNAQNTYIPESEESAREDNQTNGKIISAPLVKGNNDLRITVDVPAFLLTLWQGNKEVLKFHVGVGQKDFPIVIGERVAEQIILNPDWIPPDSEWVHESKIKPFTIISAKDPRNPLGKIKIPLGEGYLLHEAKGAGDLGNLVSHGCVRILRSDLYNLSKTIASAYNLPLSEIEKSKTDKKQRFIKLNQPLPIDIFYDTMIVENGFLHIYPDVYDYKRNTVENLRAELNAYDAGAKISDSTLNKILLRVKGKQQFVVSLIDLRRNMALTNGKLLSVVKSTK